MQHQPIQPLDLGIVELLKRELTTLCNTCDHFNACAYQDDDKGILQCELFESTTASQTVFGGMGINREEILPPVGLKGICTNCDRAWDCRLPKGSGGIWHCEEYE